MYLIDQHDDHRFVFLDRMAGVQRERHVKRAIHERPCVVFVVAQDAQRPLDLNQTTTTAE